MSIIKMYEEFIDDNDDLLIRELIKEGENTPSSNLEEIAEGEAYKKVINLGEKVIPHLLNRNSIIWDRALKQITGDGLNSLEYNTRERTEYWQNWAL